ncbi:MAG: DUF1343 domain-containing protein [Odoribacteraceae bacterium]|nr:DUF1343 domain-containing protein [Odoribacteraceae bacterium]
MNALLFACALLAAAPARVGVERFDLYAHLLADKNAAIVANRASLADGLPDVQFLARRGIRVLRVFAPEHGFRGDAAAGETVEDQRDDTGRLPVISLYGRKKAPSAEDLLGIDIMIFDLQDVGVRFYTYLSTLHHVMESCAAAGIPLIVMDRPNAHAHYVDGPVARPDHRSFIGMHPVPVVYGMTIGEYARMINGEGWLRDGLRCQLTVIPCHGWRRGDPFPLRVPPSPNLPDSLSVMLYPSLCFFEGTVVNEGRGTPFPFQRFGHPLLEGMSFAYTPRPLPGIAPSPKCAGEECRGMDLANEHLPTRAARRLNLTWLLAAYRTYRGPSPFFLPLFDLLAGNDALRLAIIAGKTEQQIRDAWQPEIDAFLPVRQRYLLPDYD